MDLCLMLGVQTPGDALNYCCEPYVSKTRSGRGFAGEPFSAREPIARPIRLPEIAD